MQCWSHPNQSKNGMGHAQDQLAAQHVHSLSAAVKKVPLC